MHAQLDWFPRAFYRVTLRAGLHLLVFLMALSITPVPGAAPTDGFSETPAGSQAESQQERSADASGVVNAAAILPVEAIECAPLFGNLPEPQRITGLGQQDLREGCILYRIRIPAGPSGMLEASGVRDCAWVFLDGERVGVMDRRQRSLKLRLPERKTAATLDVLVESFAASEQSHTPVPSGLLGPVNFKSGVTSLELTEWTCFVLPREAHAFAGLKFEKGRSGVPAFWRATFETAEAGDTFLDMRPWSKGEVWVNGKRLGSYWNVSPVQTIAIPRELLKPGGNEVVIFDVAGPEIPVVAGLTTSITNEPHPEKDLIRGRATVRLAVEPARPVHSGEFAPDPVWQEVQFAEVERGRYFSLESFSAWDGQQYAAVGEIELLDETGQSIPRDRWTIAYVDSEEQGREDGSAENVIDGQAASFWHTQWSVASPNHPHRIIVDLGRSLRISGFRYLARSGDPGTGGRIRAYGICVGDRLTEELPPAELLPEEVYLFSYFTDDNRSGLHLAWSIDGYRWLPVNQGNSLLKPFPGTSRLMRDPCLLRTPEGMFHLVWTTDWTGQTIGYASSPDLINWSGQKAIPVMGREPATVNCWAPEIYWDATRKDFLLVWSSTVTNRYRETIPIAAERSNDRLYCTTTRDFTNFAPTRVFYDPGFNLIDATLVAVSNRFALFFKDETSRPPQKNIRFAWSDRLHGPFGDPSEPISPSWVEGPTVFAAGRDHIAYFRYYVANRFGAVRSHDWKKWTDVSERLEMPARSHQGTVLKVPREVLVSLWRAGRVEIGPGPIAAELGLGNWIWSDEVADKQTCRLWRSFDIPDDTLVSRAIFRITADNGYRLLLDGREIGRGGDLNSLTAYDMTAAMTPGRHVLAVEGFNDALNAGVICGLQVQFSNGRKLQVLSDESWRIVPRDTKDWEKREQAQASWLPARLYAFAGRHVWQRPERILMAPPVTEPLVRFWQTGWFLSLLLGACVIVVACSVWLALQLVVHRRSHRMLERERARIARDIHDDLGAGLTQLTLLGELVLREPPGSPDTTGRLNKLCGRARMLLATLDEIVWVVNPRLDTVHDFAAFVCEHAQEFLKSTSMVCRLDVPDDLPATPLDLPARRNLLLAVKEALRNAAKHAQATELSLGIHVLEQRLKVTVQDNGRGFAAGSGPAGRNGLKNMNERLGDIGGTFEVQSSPGHGCCITFNLPLVARRADRWRLFSRKTAGRMQS